MSASAPLSEAEKQWLQNFEHKLEQVAANRSYSTAFLDPRQLELAEAVLRRNPAVAYTVYGGYPQAERNIMHVFPAERPGSLPVVEAVLVEWTSRDEPGHRDLLGAVMALGLRRDQIGDVVILENQQAAIFVEETKAPYIMANLNRAGRVDLQVRTVNPTELPLPQDDSKEIKGTVASLRLDAVLSLGFGISRSRVVRLIKGGLVRVNWRPVDSPSYQNSKGDQISLKGRGRLVVEAVEGETRKGRIRLILKKYA